MVGKAPRATQACVRHQSQRLPPTEGDDSPLAPPSHSEEIEKPTLLRLYVLLNSPKGSRYLLIEQLRLRDHIHYGMWDLLPQ